MSDVITKTFSPHMWLTKSDDMGIFLHWKFHSLGGGVQLMSDAVADTFAHALHAHTLATRPDGGDSLREALESNQQTAAGTIAARWCSSKNVSEIGALARAYLALKEALAAKDGE